MSRSHSSLPDVSLDPPLTVIVFHVTAGSPNLDSNVARSFLGWVRSPSAMTESVWPDPVADDGAL